MVAPPWLPPLAEVPESTYRDSFAGANGKPRSDAGYHTRGRISRISRDGERGNQTQRRSTPVEQFALSVIKLGKLFAALLTQLHSLSPGGFCKNATVLLALEGGAAHSRDGQFQGIIGGDYGLAKVNATGPLQALTIRLIVPKANIFVLTPVVSLS